MFPYVPHPIASPAKAPPREKCGFAQGRPGGLAVRFPRHGRFCGKLSAGVRRNVAARSEKDPDISGWGPVKNGNKGSESPGEILDGSV